MTKLTLKTIILIVAISLTGCSIDTETEKNKSKDVVDWQVRNEYVKNGKVLFTLFHVPELTTGETYGYEIHFTEAFETDEDIELAIYAYHKETGERIIAYSPKKIKPESTLGFVAKLNTFIFEVKYPLTGLWRYEVILDNEIYGDAILDIKE
ncbi:hypothetical protein [Chengkuizengella axinellae]|uniref:YtkA-like domain-containing protein n=1 Tax=Chengkuizengella axinellae TaxID=3064388 RepID=A0ABT9J409_9BACL|nr:hypothetical protein [Chengkuizengella sp. 2205SS18-9]MDP5276352.1 hypothetical protein [Chengkuizengella sp. 2205SS18-9]